jgi:hypothetical protein
LIFNHIQARGRCSRRVEPVTICMVKARSGHGCTLPWCGPRKGCSLLVPGGSRVTACAGRRSTAS